VLNIVVFGRVVTKLSGVTCGDYEK